MRKSAYTTKRRLLRSSRHQDITHQLFDNTIQELRNSFHLGLEDEHIDKNENANQTASQTIPPTIRMPITRHQLIVGTLALGFIIITIGVLFSWLLAISLASAVTLASIALINSNYQTSDIFIKIYRFISDDKYFDNNTKDAFHDDITKKVYRRLLLRHAVLNEVEGLSHKHRINKELSTIFPKGLLFNNPRESIPSDADHENHHNLKHNQPRHPFAILPPDTRSYNLAVTDLFVEKALAYLNRKARAYSRQGFLLFTISFITIITTTLFALFNFKFNDTAAGLPPNNDIINHYVFLQTIKGITFYGLAILIAVFTARMGKSLFDQSERIKDRRHSLRQGRLFVHLNGGMVTIEELERAFNWNSTQDNAFHQFNPEAQAPVGNLLKEMMTTLKEVTKASVEGVKNIKKPE